MDQSEGGLPVTCLDGEGATEFAVRRIRHDAWAEGARKASPHGGAYLRSILMESPYSDIAEAARRQRFRGGDG